tara:strand:+ start:1358 stop:2512 length:1155 start_codon:yes stop_codon:yes gene_type:complete
MKKNLRNILAVALGLITTVSFAQDWNVDSRTRIDMSSINGDDYMSTEQRATLGTTWGGSDWGIHISTQVDYTVNDQLEAATNLSVYEAYASTSLLGFADMTIGRQALSYGSGAYVSNNDWNTNRNRFDGMTFAINNDFVDLELGLSQRDNGGLDSAYLGLDASGAPALMNDKDMLNALWLNASKSSGDWSVNLFYADYAIESGLEANAMGLDFAYTAMGGALDIGMSYNTNSRTSPWNPEWVDGMDQDMMDLSATYNVNDGMSITAGRASYGENGFDDLIGGGHSGWYGTNSWLTHGNIGHLGKNQENLYVGGSYDMGKFSVGATMHTVTDGSDGADDYERQATEVSVGYALNNNASISYKLVTDNNGGEEDSNYNWITISVTP